MKLLLLESVPGLGRPGDQVSVKDGYARNFLLPKRHAVRLTDDSLRMLGSLNRKADEEERAMISSMEELAQKIKGTVVNVEARATDEGHLFGSVTEKDIHLALVAAGWDVEQRMVRMEFHLKEAGETEVSMHLYGEIVVLIKVNVVPLDMDGMVIDLSDPGGLEEDDGDDEDGDAGDGDAVASHAEEAPAAADA
ncbi:MAG: large subunit ribosomal protein L9 [Pseudohongiellaceae bacterium]|jgi:large subunit ribosomal protein L9